MEKRLDAKRRGSTLLSRALLFQEQSSVDLRTAKRFLNEGKYLDSVFQSVQASVNALSAVGYAHGQAQLPSASPIRLLQFCMQFNPKFEELHTACGFLEEATQANPFDEIKPGVDNHATLAKDTFTTAQQVVGLAKRTLARQLNTNPVRRFWQRVKPFGRGR